MGAKFLYFTSNGYNHSLSTLSRAMQIIICYSFMYSSWLPTQTVDAYVGIGVVVVVVFPAALVLLFQFNSENITEQIVCECFCVREYVVKTKKINI